MTKAKPGTEYGSSESAAVHALGWLDPSSGGTVPPLQPAVTNRRESYASGRIYARIDSAAYDQVESRTPPPSQGSAIQLMSRRGS